ncbi:SDR family NAD(P)-dependent oxidoreductase [Corynebacterium glyciniphilum]|uniref:SDR family NAD(P)-dependent oxidoreductase n=1 Tax=Corynebacterium glyciniphilum TaxID=1404244 RepID=UPI003DA07DE0
MDKLVAGKTAVITGASKGIGKATAQLFAEEGANVVLTARHKDELDEVVSSITAAGGSAIGVVADSSDPAAPKQVFTQAVEAFGQVDIMVNNAGYGDMYSIEETTDEHFEMVTQINFAGVFRYCREAVQHFIPRNEGTIVNVSSVNGDLPICGVAYTSTKGAVNTMTKNIAIRFSGTDIRCNAVAPGVTDTPMAKAWAAGDLAGGDTMLTYSDIYTNNELPPTRPQDQANAILYLASDMSRGVTGRVLTVDNGAFM